MTRTQTFLHANRKGFTLVELLVAMALILFIMSIISVAFVDSTESFRVFRARAELSEKLRFLTQTLRADLRSNHFENGRKLSDSDFWNQGPPKAGYFRIEQSNKYSLIGTETSTRSTTDGDPVLTADPNAKHVLMLTSFLDPSDFRGFHSVNVMPSTNYESKQMAPFKAWLNTNIAPSDSRLESLSALPAPNSPNSTTFNSPNAEIAWFVGGIGSPTASAAYTPYEFASATTNKDRLDAGDIGVTLFKLYRRVWPMLSNDVSSSVAPTTFTPNQIDQISVTPPAQPVAITDLRLQFNSVSSQMNPNVDVPTRRATGRHLANNTLAGWKSANFNTKFPSTSPSNNSPSNLDGASADWAVVADNVVSFSIEGWFEGTSAFMPLESALGAGQKVFDTWCQRSPDSARGFLDDYSGTNWKSSIPMQPMFSTNNPRRLLAVRITIRLYDLNTKSTWQATVIEYL